MSEENTDRELLELAARAAGIELNSAGWNTWNPLADDGDALRLAVKLHINIEHLRTLKEMAFKEISAYPFGNGDCLSVEETGAYPYAATRRAVVRAAAALATKGAS